MNTKSRQVKISRETQETQIQLELNLDGSGQYEINTPVAFLNHMMESFAKHGFFDLNIKAEGDTDVDFHHTVEDVAITLGQAFLKCIGDKKGMTRYGSFTLPMDEVLTTAAVDFCDRPVLVYNAEIPAGRIGDFDIELVYEWFQALTQSARMNLHINVWYGRNRHHMVESMFKALAKAMDQATRLDPRVVGVASTKGAL
ncbi:MAG: imidazoleglycerol-phosphate dehydratase HisB [Deltaproteobacteria bacterium]|nr:imidazoleglycerol-phosphate dehydratase HisB [Deltaproteobacteria bacterium]